MILIHKKFRSIILGMNNQLEGAPVSNTQVVMRIDRHNHMMHCCSHFDRSDNIHFIPQPEYPPEKLIVDNYGYINITSAF